jgi:isochorismate synthase
MLDQSHDSSLVREAAERAGRLGRPVLASWTRPTRLADAVGFFAQPGLQNDRMLWLQPARGEALVGLGVAHVITGTGANRFKHVASAWRELVADAVVDNPSGFTRGGPVLLGGFSFDPLHTPSKAWSGFPDARMLLPERMLAVEKGAAWLTSNVVVDPRDGSNPQQSDEAAPSTGPEPTPLSPAAWKALVGSVARGIRHGQLGLEKVVLARVEHIRQASPIDPSRVLRTLAASYPSCTVFAVARGEACFLGATPERLVALRNGSASTFALAGSVPRGATPADDQRLAERLLRDPKELAEHAVVVGALRDGLAADGLCVRIVADAQPRVQKLPNVQHLLTPVRGQVADGRSVLDLVERLHPTPAVGGFPTRRALELIRRCEALDRGWYAGPVGWINRDGEGDFVVAIRSALLRGETAALFAGCGIVRESNAAAEYAESRWKLRPMLAALGLEA